MADPAGTDPSAPTRADLAATGFGPLAGAKVMAQRQLVHRVGYVPDPWAWTPWQYAHDGRFPGRWDDPDGLWRTLYVGDSRLACYLEVLACFRPDPALAAELDAIVEDRTTRGTTPQPRRGSSPRTGSPPGRSAAPA